jgi:hypothetical protein
MFGSPEMSPLYPVRRGVLHIMITETDPIVQPDLMADDLG